MNTFTTDLEPVFAELEMQELEPMEAPGFWTGLGIGVGITVAVASAAVSYAVVVSVAT